LIRFWRTLKIRHQLIVIKSEGEIVVDYEGEPLYVIDHDGNVSD
jgi:hypothetical protein